MHFLHIYLYDKHNYIVNSCFFFKQTKLKTLTPEIRYTVALILNRFLILQSAVGNLNADNVVPGKMNQIDSNKPIPEY